MAGFALAATKVVLTRGCRPTARDGAIEPPQHARGSPGALKKQGSGKSTLTLLADASRVSTFSGVVKGLLIDVGDLRRCRCDRRSA